MTERQALKYLTFNTGTTYAKNTQPMQWYIRLFNWFKNL